MEQYKPVGDALAASTGIAAFLGWLPHIASLLTVVWFAMRMYESWLEVRIKRLQIKKLQDEAKEKPDDDHV